jgi:hypothetical protein
MAGPVNDVSGSPDLPARPYSAPDQLGGNAPRSAELLKGAFGDPGSIASIRNQDPGLNINSQQFNQQVAQDAVRPMSVLQPIMRNPGGNGMSAGDAARRTFDGQYLGSVNGTSQSSFEPSALLRLTTGQDAQ